MSISAGVNALIPRRWVATRLLLVVATIPACVGCGYFAARELAGTEVPAPPDFNFVGEMSPCYLELREGSKALRVNCFQIDGVLHIHSSRWAKLPRLGAENWSVTVRRAPNVRVEIEDRIYALQAFPIDDESLRKMILYDRGYWHAWDGITIVRFMRHENPIDAHQRAAWEARMTPNNSLQRTHQSVTPLASQKLRLCAGPLSSGR